MNPNVKAVEKIAVAGMLDPATVANSEVFTSVVDMSKYHQVMAILALGNMANETIDFKCYRCDANGSNAVSLKTATQLTASASANDNKQVVMNVTADELIASGAQYVKFSAVTGNSTGGPAAIVVLGVDARFQPVTQPSAVVQTVS